MKQGINISIPNRKLMDKVAKEKQFVYKGRTFKEGDVITLEIFGITKDVKMFFDETKKMLMFQDPYTKVYFNVLGYLNNLKM